MEQLPSKRVLILGLALTAVIALVLISTDPNESESELVASTINGELDSDSDGLADWEEELWQTDPLNPDTDGDGTSDGEEVANNRHPRVAGDDAVSEEHKDIIYLSNQTPISGKDIVENTIIPNVVLAGSKRVIGYSTGASDVETLFNPLIEEANKKISFYSLKDIVIDTRISVEDYFISLLEIAIVAGEKESQFEQPTTILARVYAGEAGAIEKLSELITLYEDTLEAYLSLPTTPAFREDHLEIVNSYGTLVYGLTEAEKALEDPASGLVGLEQFEQGEERLQDVFYKIGEKVRN